MAGSESRVSKQRGRIGRGARPRIEISLGLVAALRLQEFALLGRLDPFGEHPQAEPVRERDDRLRDGGVAAALRHRGDERAVDLETVDRQSGEIAQARIAGAEVVDRDQHAERDQPVEDRDRCFAVLDQHPLGDLELQRAAPAGRAVARRVARR